MKNLLYDITDWIGFVLCEAAFKTNCWGPMDWVYKLGCKAYWVRPFEPYA